ncbi:MAG: Bug family tripartite tricarboxylate transporter substrate binding protein [Burkholderiales bacterium]
MKELVWMMSLAMAAIALVPSDGIAQTGRPLRLVVPYGSGGAPDVVSRTLAQRLGETAGWQVIVENRPGAGGVVAAEAVMKSPADGLTVFIADTGHYAISPALIPKLPYDPLRDFVPVSHIASTPLVFAANIALPASTMAELITLAKAKPVNYGSSGNGSPHHLGMEMLKLIAKIDMVHIPYKGVAQSVPALLAGDVSVILVGVPSIQPHVRAGKAKLLAVSSVARSSLVPDLPTAAESGAPDFDLTVTIGMLAPAGTPRDAVMRLHDEVAKVLKEPEIVRKLAGLGIVAIGDSPETLASIIRIEQDKFARLVKASGAKVD